MPITATQPRCGMDLRDHVWNMTLNLIAYGSLITALSLRTNVYSWVASEELPRKNLTVILLQFFDTFEG